MSSVMAGPLLKVDRIVITTATGRRIVDDVSFNVNAGEIIALVGESGSGKTTIGRAILRLLAPGLACASGDIVFRGKSLLQADSRELRDIRGSQIAAVFQDPMASLNPSLTVGSQMMEGLRLHEGLRGKPAKARCLGMLERVKIADPERCFGDYPGKFSGGMRQRFMLASVLLTRPALLIADEPTTALDAIIRKEIMEQIIELTRDTGTAVLLVSHDLAMVSQHANRSIVLRNGAVMDQGEPRQVLLQPRVAYTRQLLEAFPVRDPGDSIDVEQPSLVRVDRLNVSFRKKRKWVLSRSEEFLVVKDVSFEIRTGEVLAVVGESGSGKSTIARTLLKLHSPSSGEIRFHGDEAIPPTGRKARGSRQHAQMIFQDSGASLDPRMTIEQAVAEPLRNCGVESSRNRSDLAKKILKEVGLAEDKHGCYPHQLSGGQRQRVGIARAIVAGSDLVIADEPVSALDVSIQRQILDLLKRLRAAHNLTYLFISHDLDVVEEIADRVMVMHQGSIVEIGPRDAIFDTPRHPYTRALLDATPRIRRVGSSSYHLASAPKRDPAAPNGFSFDPPEMNSFRSERMAMVEVTHDHFVRCWRA